MYARSSFQLFQLNKILYKLSFENIENFAYTTPHCFLLLFRAVNMRAVSNMSMLYFSLRAYPDHVLYGDCPIFYL